MFGLFKRQRIPPRHRSSAYMNLAFGKIPTDVASVGTWDQRPAPLIMLTDADKSTNITTIGEHSTDAETLTLEIDLGQEYEVYEILVHNRTGTGFKKAATAQDVTLVTLNAAAAAVTRDTQAIAGDDAYKTSTLHYKGQGIPVQKVQIKTLMNSANKFTLALADIEVFGC